MVAVFVGDKDEFDVFPRLVHRFEFGGDVVDVLGSHTAVD